MLKYSLRQFNLLLLTLFILSVFSFWLAFALPGDPLANLSGVSNPTNAERLILESKYQTHAGYVAQYLRYLELFFQGDWGVSLSSGKLLLNEISRTLPASIELTSYALVLSLLLGIPLGMWAGLKHHKPIDSGLLTVSVIGNSLPVFWLALIIIMLFSLQLGWLPLSGRISLLFDVPQQTGFILLDIWLSDIPDKVSATVDALRHLLMPTLSIAVVTFSIVLRISRRSVIETMHQEYIKAAYARGHSQLQVFVRHGFRNALLPILPLLISQFTTLLTNAMIVEVVFSWPGIGNWLLQAIYQRDYPAIRVGMLAVAALVLIFSVALELLLRLINPTLHRQAHATS